MKVTGLRHTTPISVHFDGMSWPRAGGERMADIESALRHGVATLEEMLVAASVLDAYHSLVRKPAKQRAEIVSHLRAAEIDS